MFGNICTSSSGGFALARVIGANTTPLEFEDFMRNNPQYEISDGGRCGWNILHLSCSYLNVEMVEWLMAHPNKNDFINLCISSYWAPIHILFKNDGDEFKKLEILKLLIENGANYDLSCRQDGKTLNVLDLALAKRNIECCKYLLSLDMKYDYEKIDFDLRSEIFTTVKAIDF